METRVLRDILRQPAELACCLDRLLGTDRARMKAAAALLRKAPEVYIAGIGASWNAGLAASSFFSKAGRAVPLGDASELMHQESFSPGSAILALSRSGKSVEMVRLADREPSLVAVTNAPESPLALRADETVPTGVGFDHGVSVVTYSAIALAGSLVAAEATEALDLSDLGRLARALEALPSSIAKWRGRIRESDWFAPEAPTYFLGRGASLSTAYEARLLWEEAAKAPASALSSGGFRHGVQEIVDRGLRVGMWVDAERRREEDLCLARDLRRLGAKVLLVGQNLCEDEADLVFDLPDVPAPWQFALDVLPAQLAAEHLSHVRSVDCDAFRLCSYVVESEGGIRTDLPALKEEKR